MRTLVMLLMMITFHGREDLSTLRPGDIVQGFIEKGDKTVQTRILDGDPTRENTSGKRYILNIREPGTYAVEMKSLFLDAYLILRDGEDRIISEDDNSLYGLQARMVFKSDSDQVLQLDACSLHGTPGGFQLELKRTDPAGLSPWMEDKALRKAWDHLQILEKRIGPQSDSAGKLALSGALRLFAIQLNERGAYDAAQPVFERCLRIHEGVFGPDHPALGALLYDFALLLTNMGAFDEARIRLEQSIRFREAAFGTAHPETANGIVELALVLENLGFFKEAAFQAERALKIREEVLGPDHQDTAVALLRLASALKLQGLRKEAGVLLNRALKIFVRVYGPGHFETACCLNAIAMLRYDEGRLREAREGLEGALEVLEETCGPEHPETLYALENLALVLQDQGEYREALKIHEQVLHIREEALGTRHPALAPSLNNLASVLHDLGKLEEALVCIKRALKICEERLGPDHPDTAAYCTSLGYLLQEHMEYDEAGRLYERALRIREEELDSEHPDIALSLNNLSALLTKRGEYEEALDLQKRAYRIHEKTLGPESPTTITTLNNLAHLYYIMGRFEEARPMYEKAVRIKEKITGPDHPDIALYLSNLALLLEQQGLYDEARPLLERARSICLKHIGMNHPMTATVQHNLAQVLMRLGDQDKAMPILERSIETLEKSYGPDHPDLALALNSMAFLLKEKGEGEAAKRMYEHALRIIDQSLGSDHPRKAKLLCNLAFLLVALEADFEKAKALMERALVLIERFLGTGHVTFSEISYSLAIILCDLSEYDRAWQLASGAFSSSESQMLHHLWSLSEQERLVYVSRKVWFLNLILSLSERLSPDGAPGTSYDPLLRWKGRVSRSLLQGKERLALGMTTGTEALLTQLEQIQSELSTTLYGGAATGMEPDRNRLQKLRARRAELEIDLVRSLGPEQGKTKPTTAELRAALPESAAIVDFYVHPWYQPAVRAGGKLERQGVWSKSHLSAWILRKGEEQVVHLDLGPADAIQKAVSAFLQTMIASERSRGITRERKKDSSHGGVTNDLLRSLIWKPIAEQVQSAQIIFISPDSFLGTLPFEVIRLEDQTYLIEHHAFVYLQDMASLNRITERHSKQKAPGAGEIPPSFLAVGNVDYDGYGEDRSTGREEPEEEKSEYAADAEGRTAAHHAAFRGGIEHRWKDLPETDDEAQAITELYENAFSGERDCMYLQDDEANEERIKAALPEYNMVHIASHGFFQPTWLPSMWEQTHSAAGTMDGMVRPERKRLKGMLPGYLSGLVLAGANTPPEAGRDDGYLTAEEMTWIDLSKANLVVLSACETGLGSARSGEGMIGLRRSLRMAGADTVISSLWIVKDESTSELMQGFYYRLWLFKKTKLDALRSAQLDMLENNRSRYGHGLPSTWGAFVLDGDWR